MIKNDATSIDAYIAGFPPEVQELLQQIRATVQELAPEAREAMKYAIPTFTLGGNLVHFAAFKNHIGLYPTPGVLEAFKDELAGYKGSKGAVQFPLDQPLPMDLIARIVQYRIAEMAIKAPKPKK